MARGEGVMTEEQEANLDRLLIALRVSDPKVLAVKMMEAVGMSVMCIHWLRGLFNILETNGAINLSPGALDNFHLLRDSIEAYEAFLWRIAPPRAMTHAIGVFREAGFLDPDFEMLLRGDAWGRACDRPDTDEIRDVLGNVMHHDSRVKPEEEWEKYGGR
jgi:hypothetical protein